MSKTDETRVYTVLETFFLDQPAPSDDDWATSKVHVFSTMECAETFVKAKEREYCIECLDENGDEEERERGYVDEDGELVENLIGDLFDELTRGAYIPSTYMLEIDEHIVDAHCLDTAGKKRKLRE